MYKFNNNLYIWFLIINRNIYIIGTSDCICLNPHKFLQYERVVRTIGRFIDIPNERSLVNTYIDSYMDGTKRYAKYIDNAPNFVIYYSKNFEYSTENSGLGNVKEIVGLESPLKYNKIENFPLFNVDELSPSIDIEDIGGVDTEMEGSALVLPDTITPQPDDLFVFSYHESDQEHYRLYRVTNVTMSAIDSNTYYQISYIVSPYDIDILNSRMIIDEYNLIYSNIGTDSKTMLIKSEYTLVSNLDKLYDSFVDLYKADYYNSRVNCFLYYDNYNSEFFYDPGLHEFISRNSLFIDKRTFLTNLMIENPIKMGVREYIQTPFYYLENKDKFDLFNIPFNFLTGVFNSSIFALFPEKFNRIDYYKINDGVLFDIETSLFDNNINEIINTYVDPENLLVDKYERVFTLFIKDSENLEDNIINEIYDDYLMLTNTNLRNYILVPCLLYIIKSTIENVLNS